MSSSDEEVRASASSESTAIGIQSLLDTVNAQISNRQFDIAALGEGWEAMGKDFPLVGDYVKTRRKLFAEADKIGIGRVVRVLYHATETGARTSAALASQAAALAASNYGAAGAATLGASGLIAAASGPIGVGVMLATAVLSFLAEGDMTPEEALASAQQFYAARQTAIRTLATLNDGSHATQRSIAEQVGFLAKLEAVAALGDDPASFIKHPEVAEKYRTIIRKKGATWADTADEKALSSDVAKRSQAIRAAWQKALQERNAKKAVNKKAVVWMGPVGTRDVSGATVPDAVVKFISCTGDGKPSCGDIAESWTDGKGQKIPGLLQEVKLPSGTKLWSTAEAGDDTTELWLGAFSAGGHIVKRVLNNDADRARVHAVLLADATYVASWKDEKARVPDIIEGFVKLGVDAERDGRLFVATASSSPNKTHPTGAETLAALRKEIEARVGRPFEDVTASAATLFPGLKAPVSVHRMNRVVFADFGGQYAHAEHATIVAPVVWATVIPALHQTSGSTPSGAKAAPPATSDRARPPGLLDRIRDLPSPLKWLGAGVAAVVVAAVVTRKEKEDE